MSEFENVTAAPPPPPGVPTAEEKQWAMFAHLSALTALFTGGLGAVIGPLIVWLVKKDTLPFADDQGKEALNFNITVLIAVVALTIVGTILLIVLIGFLFYLAAGAIGIAWLVFTIIAAIKASNGEAYRYPLTLRLVK
ncbi:DUF4870 domain-containing protein [Pseudoxanthomonas putridarboris]|uniref:DUF4870 domain-containing protein n=1 Tax=Pseudoxanthomonas putridarboris TaxID=752605 RepID=A0ABU9IY51_9GAMM